MKGIVFVGNSLESLKSFSPQVMREAGFQFDKVQHGLNSLDWKPMKGIGGAEL